MKKRKKINARKKKRSNNQFEKSKIKKTDLKKLTTEPFFKKLWIFFFLIWSFLLTGALSQWMETPGLIQFFHLNVLVENRKEELKATEESVKITENKIKEFLSKNSLQETEIRNRLGYAHPDDLIFDFSNQDKITLE